MTDLNDSLQRMSFMQLVLLFGFITAYVLALGAMLGSAARRHSAALAIGCAIGFAACTDPWVNGALLMVFVVAGIGVFVMLSWLLARLSSPRQQSAGPAQAAGALETAALPPAHAEPSAMTPKGTASAMR